MSRVIDVHLEFDSVTRDLKSLGAAIDQLSRWNSILLKHTVDEWADAKFAKDFERADRLREVLHSVGVEPLMGSRRPSA